jgi:hypothetical protein
MPGRTGDGDGGCGPVRGERADTTGVSTRRSPDNAITEPSASGLRCTLVGRPNPPGGTPRAGGGAFLRGDAAPLQ